MLSKRLRFRAKHKFLEMRRSIPKGFSNRFKLKRRLSMCAEISWDSSSIQECAPSSGEISSWAYEREASRRSVAARILRRRCAKRRALGAKRSHRGRSSSGLRPIVYALRHPCRDARQLRKLQFGGPPRMRSVDG